MTESHLSRKQDKKFCGLCFRTSYEFVSPDGAKHDAVRARSNCIERACGWWACKQLHDTTRFQSARVRARTSAPRRASAVAHTPLSCF